MTGDEETSVWYIVEVGNKKREEKWVWKLGEGEVVNESMVRVNVKEKNKQKTMTQDDNIILEKRKKLEVNLSMLSHCP